MNTTPSAALHRVLKPLNWVRTEGVPLDGDVKKVKGKDGVITLALWAQPRAYGRAAGVSFFVPDMAHDDAVHAYFGRKHHGCGVVVPNTSLPSGIEFVQDFLLELPLEGDQRIVCGKHYTMFTTADVTCSEFEAAYSTFMSSAIQCEPMKAAAQLDVDMDYMPSDPKTYVVVVALDEVVDNTHDPNIKLFCAPVLAPHAGNRHGLQGPTATATVCKHGVGRTRDVDRSGSTHGSERICCTGCIGVGT